MQNSQSSKQWSSSHFPCDFSLPYLPKKIHWNHLIILHFRFISYWGLILLFFFKFSFLFYLPYLPMKIHWNCLIILNSKFISYWGFISPFFLKFFLWFSLPYWPMKIHWICRILNFRFLSYWGFILSLLKINCTFMQVILRL